LWLLESYSLSCKIIRNKELIPADSVLIDGDGQIDYSFVTGESSPVMKKINDFIYAGGRQMGGIIKIKVQKEVNQSHLTKLWNQDKSYEKPSDSLKTLVPKCPGFFLARFPRRTLRLLLARLRIQKTSIRLLRPSLFHI